MYTVLALSRLILVSRLTAVPSLSLTFPADGLSSGYKDYGLYRSLAAKDTLRKLSETKLISIFNWPYCGAGQNLYGSVAQFAFLLVHARISQPEVSNQELATFNKQITGRHRLSRFRFGTILQKESDAKICYDRIFGVPKRNRGAWLQVFCPCLSLPSFCSCEKKSPSQAQTSTLRRSSEEETNVFVRTNGAYRLGPITKTVTNNDLIVQLPLSTWKNVEVFVSDMVIAFAGY